MIATYRYRVKDRHQAALRRHANAVNFVWNYCNDTQRTAVQRGARWPSRFDLIRLMTGASADIGLSFGTLSEVATRYTTALRQAHSRRLRYRSKRSLGWLPLRGMSVRVARDKNTIRISGRAIDVWLSRALPIGVRVKDGSSFAEDARGRWYLNLVLDVPDAPRASGATVGIDIGLKSLATLSDGRSYAAPQIFRKQAGRLAVAKRARRKKLARAIHAKIANQRRDVLHKLSTEIARTSGDLYVGNVTMNRGHFAKSALDAGWSTLRRLLRYKAIARGNSYTEVNERNTTQTCSACGCIGGPKGRKGLVMRAWVCPHCGASHDRDVNAARNILTLGLGRQALAREAVAV